MTGTFNSSLKGIKFTTQTPRVARLTIAWFEKMLRYSEMHLFEHIWCH